MKKSLVSTIDCRYLSEKAARIIMDSDQYAKEDLFGQYNSIEEINEAAEELYEELYGSEE